jgi:hypothetical protein
MTQAASADKPTNSLCVCCVPIQPMNTKLQANAPTMAPAVLAA